MKNKIMDMKKGNKVCKRIYVIYGMLMAAYFTFVLSSPVYAANDIVKGIDNLKTVVTAAVVAIGGIVLVKNVMEFASAYQQQDSSGMNSALKGIVGGIMMAGVAAVLKVMGV